ncbi:MAG: hypothetical protein IJT21_03415 [Synergistaceae bacterium]|nr:hypothetical protein [Synergistaceae bacterium]
MKEYITPSITSSNTGKFAFPAIIAGLSIAEAFALGAAAAIKGDKSVSVDMPSGLEPIYAC